MRRIGIRAELLGKDLRRAIRRAAELGFEAVQLDVAGEVAPDRLSRTGRDDLRKYVSSLGLRLSAWHYPARLAHDVGLRVEEHLETLTKVFRLAFETGAPIVVTALGRIPTDPAHPARAQVEELLEDLARLADHWGAVVALETGTEPGETLAELLRAVDSPALRCNYDPANLYVKGYDPLAAFEPLVDFIVHCHAWDARLDAVSETGTVVPLGSGEVPWPEIARYIREAAFQGYVIVEQLGNAAPADRSARAALQYLRRIG